MTVVTDHKPLVPIFKKYINKSPKRLQRMLLTLQKYDIEVVHKKGTEMYISDMLSRAAIPLEKSEDPKFDVLAAELEAVNCAEYLHISNTRLKNLKVHTNCDENLKMMKKLIVTGWPTKAEVPHTLMPYHQFRDELSVQDELIFKNDRILVPKSMRSEVLSRIHCSHLGLGSCLRKARDVVFWPGMKSDIQNFIEKCETCAEIQPKQRKEPMLSYDIPYTPWSTLAMDLFQLDNKDYIVLVDFYSDFFEIEKLTSTTSGAVIRFLKESFARHGIPSTLISDNGPQFVSEEFKRFVRKWEFLHVTSSPYHSQFNGKAEATVKCAKNLIKKCKSNGEDAYKALLDLSNTPTEGINSSPVQRLMSRRTRGMLYTNDKLLEPEVQLDVRKKIQEKRTQAKSQYDKGSRQLPKLEIEQDVWVKSTNPKSTQWSKATCLGEVAPRSYMLRHESGQILRRNRAYLKPRSDTPNEVQPNESQNDIPLEQPHPADPGNQAATQPGPDAVNIPASDAQKAPNMPETHDAETNDRSGPIQQRRQDDQRPQRQRKQPEKFRDYQMT